MTTLIGMVSEKKKPAVILASDLSGTRSFWTPRGDVAYRRQTRQETQKIYVDDRGEIAIGMSGVIDQNYQDFLSDVLGGKINVREAIEKGFFKGLLDLHLGRWEGKIPDMENSNSLLIATRFDGKPKLHTCYPLGKTEERSWTSIGSGSGYALEYIGKSDKLIPKRIGIDEALDLVVKSLDEASQDIYTVGLDLVIVGSEKIYPFGERIKSSLEKSREMAISSIRKEFS